MNHRNKRNGGGIIGKRKEKEKRERNRRRRGGERGTRKMRRRERMRIMKWNHGRRARERK